MFTTAVIGGIMIGVGAKMLVDKASVAAAKFILKKTAKVTVTEVAEVAEEASAENAETIESDEVE